MEHTFWLQVWCFRKQTSRLSLEPAQSLELQNCLGHCYLTESMQYPPDFGTHSRFVPSIGVVGVLGVSFKRLEQYGRLTVFFTMVMSVLLSRPPPTCEHFRSCTTFLHPATTCLDCFCSRTFWLCSIMKEILIFFPNLGAGATELWSLNCPCLSQVMLFGLQDFAAQGERHPVQV